MTTISSDKDPWLAGDSSKPGSAQAGAEPSYESSDRPVEGDSAPTDEETWRLFVAVALPEAVRESMAELGNRLDTRLRDRVRWTLADNIHITLQFLGDTDPKRVIELIKCLEEVAGNSSPFTISAGKTGAFPLFRNPKILWIGFDGETKRLEQLQGRVEGGLARLGFEPERRKWTAHATVGRALRDLNGRNAADLGFSWKRTVGPRNYEKFLVASFVLFRSHLKSGGPVYEKVHEFKLGG